MDAQDTGIRWSTHQFHTQLLPGSVPVCVDVMERFDAFRAARHARVRAALRTVQGRGSFTPSRCPNCDHDLTTVPDEHLLSAGLPVPDPAPRPFLDPELPPLMMTRVIETIAGRRPVTQLAHVASSAVLRYVRIETERTRRGLPPTVRTLHVQHVDHTTAELFGLVAVGPRLIAYCARLDLIPRGWRMTALRLMHGPMVHSGSTAQRKPRSAHRRPRSRAKSRTA